MNVKSFAGFKKKVFRVADIQGQALNLTISAVGVEKLGKDAEEKIVVRFADHEKGLTLNVTNLGILTEVFGEETDGWLHKKVSLFVEPVKFGDSVVDSIKVKPIAGVQKAGVASDSPTMQMSTANEFPSELRE